MAQITCKCGTTYDAKFKFCPECAEPNPQAIKKKTKLTEVSEDVSEKPVKKKFTKVGESSLRSPSQNTSSNRSYSIVRQNQVKPAPKPATIEEPDELYEEYEDDEESVTSYEEEVNDEAYDYEDDAQESSDSEVADFSDSEDFEDYEDEDESSLADMEDDEDEAYEEPVVSSPKVSSKVLTAPSVKPIKKAAKSNITEMPKTKKIASTKSSLGKKKPEYDPNHDGYYDDRLPALLDEVTKTSHLDVFLKIGLSAVCIAALITYCIFYVQV